MKPPHVNTTAVEMELDIDRTLATVEKDALADLLRRLGHALLEQWPPTFEELAAVRADGRLRYKLRFAPVPGPAVTTATEMPGEVRNLFGKTANGKG